MSKPNIHNNIIGSISSFQNGHNNLFSSTGFYLFFEVVTFFLAWWLFNQLNFSMAARIYKIHVFDKAYFLLTNRMPMATKRFRVVTCCEELSPKNIHDTSM